MSELIVEVCEISKVEDHPNADRLNINTIKGWTIISNKTDEGEARYKVGDRVVYFPPDSILPDELIDRLNIRNYVAPLKNTADGTQRGGGRVKAINLRGEPSYGVLMPLENPDWEVGKDVKDHYGVEKWEPPVKEAYGDMGKDNILFHRYTSIENFGNFPDWFQEGEEVVFTEKIHGSNSRLGKVKNEEGVFDYIAGSNRTVRKKEGEGGTRSFYWFPLSEDIEDWTEIATGVKGLLDYLCNDEKNIQIFGEIFGSGVQDMAYGLPDGKKTFRAFDITVDGEYLDFEVKNELFERFNIPQVPILYKGPFSKEILKEYTTGETTLCGKKQAGPFKGREGVVIVPIVERKMVKTQKRIILKSISVDYLARKNPTDSH